MQNRAKIIVAVLILLVISATGAFLIRNKGSLNLNRTRNYIDIRIGSTFNEKMRIREEKNKFKLGDIVYYDITSKKEFNKDSTVTIILKLKDSNNKLYSKELKTYNKKLEYPVQPIEITKSGNYVLQAMYESKVIAEKTFEIK